MKYIRMIFDFVKEIYKNKFVVYQLTKRDYKNKYIGSFLGFIWTIIQPLVMILVLWFVFTKAFNSGPIRDIPFSVWLTIGLVPWYFFSEALTTSTSALQEYSYLVKKVQFQTAILPIIKLLSAFITHIIFIIIGIIILLINDVGFSIYWLQAFYYLIAMFILLVGLSWITSAIQVFVKDTAQIISVILQFGFWLTPILWDFKILPEKYDYILKTNPMFYIMEGYRNSFIYHAPFWEAKNEIIYFWTTTIIILLIGIIIFKKLKPHFADVL
ncbi:MAG: ABC transporter, teichoic acid transport system permease protein [Candidatus Peregrinibacteria bacterium GW2011_GWC2_39_14]|nr:MAG: O-antigen export system permease protein rfbA [Candidatus Peregrinibacteria bacterium GW2011_GWA2_38_36]KKR05933.1 MAG: ABC transporter, teichoic acid transport system permease protein [Candidatus Peregrinibacteria bacterium GW2011_GWC2_39_14]